MTNTCVEFVQITPHMEGQRIDNFLLSHLKGVPRSLVYRILRKGEVRVNRGRIKAHYRLKEGDEVRIPPVRRSETRVHKPSQSLTELLEAAILFEDEQLIILNKPCGLAVHGGSGISHGLIEALRANRPDAPFLELVHRLDRDTSGCLMIAKRRSMLRTLHEMLRENAIHKRYLTLLQGSLQRNYYKVTRPLKKNTLASGERMVRVDVNEGKSATSHFHLLEAKSLASLCKVEIETGRTHQIRVHAQALHHPVAGDEKYGNDEFNKQMKTMGLKRMFLHAFQLEFHLKERDQHILVNAPLDADLTNTLNSLGITAPQELTDEV